MRRIDDDNGDFSIIVEDDGGGVVVLENNNDCDGGYTKTHYVPSEAREPAVPLRPRPDSDLSIAIECVQTLHDPPVRDQAPPSSPLSFEPCPLCAVGAPLADLAEIAAWSCGHWIRKTPQPIAKMFQDMLRNAYQAGILAATSGETFESWYRREVLR